MNKNKHSAFWIFVVITLAVAIMITACDGSSGGQSPVDPTQATGEGGGPGPGEEPEEPEEPENDGEEDDIEPVPLDVCNTADTLFSFGIQYNEVTWFGPPKVDLRQGGFYSVLPYEYDHDTFVGKFSMQQGPEATIPITITFPDCRSDPYETSVNFRARVEGTCKNGTISLKVFENWDSVNMNIPCEANSDVCGEDPCTFPYMLPFAWAGEAGISVEYQLSKGGTSCSPGEIPLDFQGVGATGQKIYRMDCQ